MYVAVLSLCILLCESLSGLILPQTTPDGSTDLTSLLSHVTLLEQTVTGLQTTTVQLQSDLQANKAQAAAEISSLKNEMASLKAELRVSSDNLSILQNQSLDNMQLVMALASKSRKASFQVSLQLIRSPANIPLKFSHVDYNAGSAYNTTTGKFTAPVSGTYMFWTHLEMWNSTSYTYVYIKKSGGVNIVTGYLKPHTSSNYADASAVTVTHLDRGEYAWVEMSSFHFVYGDTSSYFGGAILLVDG
ncbi:adiponectin-like [Haliotis rufescens]|uniref:adiponectin-like n=1 Tax=Haliotis rufescens TaxID=6454 RepID=UPI00201ED17A|nr:adiponectin-like [Haliotis rufescens]